MMLLISSLTDAKESFQQLYAKNKNLTIIG